jgi:uncharacterized membrane protein YidH (DUF202 family)
MLGKLLKYEIKATARTFLPMYALLVVFAVINKFFVSLNAEYLRIPQAIAMSVFGIIIVGICVMTLVVTIQRFNKNLLSDEGYLSFTLPVKTHTHIDCKMIVSLMWSFLSVLVSFAAIFILALDGNTGRILHDFFAEVMPAFNSYGATGYTLALEVIVLFVVSALGGVVSIYAAITIGNMSSKHKLLAGVGAYLGFGIIKQIVASIIISSFSKSFVNYFNFMNSGNTHVILNGMSTILLGTIVYQLVFALAFYFFTDWMLKKKLNLE